MTFLRNGRLHQGIGLPQVLKAISKQQMATTAPGSGCDTLAGANTSWARARDSWRRMRRNLGLRL